MAEFLFEVSSEAARQIGGIYTVLQSKAPYMKKKYGANYCLVGFLDEKSKSDLVEKKPPAQMARAFAALSPLGIKFKYGLWAYGASVPVILVGAKEMGERRVEYFDGYKKLDKKANYLKFLLWKNFSIDSLMENSYDFTENVVWGFAVGMLLEELLKGKGFRGKKTVCHFHEWICAAALLYLKMNNVQAATVFTTHATVLGRSLSSTGRDVLAEASKAASPIAISEAYRLKIEGKHQLELQAALNADVFTTVSETVAAEVQYILGKKPDIITLNGLDFSGSGQSPKTMQRVASYVRSELLQFVESCFIPYYVQHYDNALLVFISGRYEFLNKGFDIYINALSQLNRCLASKAARNQRRIFAFIFAPSAVRGPKISIIKNYLLLDKINEFAAALPQAKGKTYHNAQSLLQELKGREKSDVANMMGGFVRDGPSPHINCFDLNYADDIIIKACISAGLTNKKEDAVKVLFYPTYLKPNDGLMNLSYYDIIAGMDVGVFPSRYEPFGYTPVEAGLKMNVAITSDTTGFGRFIKSKVPSLKKRGLKVISMAGKSSSDASRELAGELEALYFADEKKLASLKKDSLALVRLCDWKILGAHYFNAHRLALARKFAGKKHGLGNARNQTAQIRRQGMEKSGGKTHGT
ncbi:glycogen/starch synthase [Candidatus Micrarchaeota archaeon]|nr:glycogen/starch synthase [Candidatus Micrarchaeota archaeon]